MQNIFPSPGSDDPTQHPNVLARILATLARNAGGEIRLTSIENRAMMALYVDPATMEYVVRVSDVPWPCRED
jgi:hypothetical protein